MIGVSCCAAEEFARAVDLVRRNERAVTALVTHEFPLERARAALLYAMHNPGETMKVVIRMES